MYKNEKRSTISGKMIPREKYHLLLCAFSFAALGLFVFSFSPFSSRNNEERVVKEILGQPDKEFLEDVNKSLHYAKSWLFRDVLPSGLFDYTYNPVTDEESTKNNETRQLLASRILAAECAKTSDEEICKKHRQNLEFIFTHWYKEGKDGGYIKYSKRSKLGGNAAFLLTLISSPYFDAYKNQAEALFRNILYLQNEDGSFRPWYIKPSYTYYEDHLLTFYSGEALLALVEYYQKTKNIEVLLTARKSQDYYIRHYVDEIKKNYYPAYVPWQTQSLVRLYAIKADRRYADAVFTLNDKLLEIQNRTDYIGRFYNPETPQYGFPHSSSDGVSTEGLVYALSLAKTVGDTQREDRYRDAIKLAVHNLRELQYKPSLLSNFSKSQSRFVGALRADAENPWIRIDTTQHTIDAFEQILKTW